MYEGKKKPPTIAGGSEWYDDIYLCGPGRAPACAALTFGRQLPLVKPPGLSQKLHYGLRQLVGLGQHRGSGLGQHLVSCKPHHGL